MSVQTELPPKQARKDFVDRLVDLNNPATMEHALNPPGLVFDKIWPQAIDKFLGEKGPMEYVEYTIFPGGANHNNGMEYAGLYHEMIWGARKAYDKMRGSGPQERENYLRAARALAWAMVWPEQEGYRMVDGLEKDFDSRLENEGLHFPGLANAIVGRRDGSIGDQINLWQMAKIGLLSVVNDSSFREEYERALLGDILTLNVLRDYDPSGDEPGEIQKNLRKWLSRYEHRVPDGHGRAQVESGGHTKIGMDAVAILVRNLTKYEIRAGDPRRTTALLNVIDFYDALPIRDRIDGLTTLIDIEDEDIRDRASGYLQDYWAIHTKEVISHFTECASSPLEDEKIVAAKFMRFLPTQMEIPGLSQAATVLTSDSSQKVQQYALESAGVIEGDESAIYSVREHMREIIETRRRDVYPDVRIYLYGHLPQVVTPDLALAVCEQGFSEGRPVFTRPTKKSFVDAVTKWKDEGTLDKQSLHSKVSAFAAKWHGELGIDATYIASLIHETATIFPGESA